MLYKKYFLLFAVIFLSLFGLIFWLGKKGTTEFTKEEKPNLILISVDSLRSDHVSSYGYYRQTTPNIDNLAKEGILFKNYITQSYLTPISEMALHTGMYPSLSGLTSFETVLPENILTLAQILKIYNYRTAAFGNSPEFLVYPALEESFSRKFDIYNFKDEGEWVRYRNKTLNQNEIFNFLKEGKEPFFLWLAIGSVHSPYDKFPRVFGDLNYQGPLKDYFLDWGLGGILPWIFNNVLYKTEKGEIIEKINLNKEDIQYVIDRYDDGIFATDGWIGNFLKELKKRGLDRNTIIVLASEHGEELGEHGYIHHYDIFDSTIKTPLIIKNPKLNKKNVVIENQVQSIDILPTILDFLNIPKTHQIEGSSLVSLISDQASKNFNEYVFTERVPLWEVGLIARIDSEGKVTDEREPITTPELITSLEQYFESTIKKQAAFYNWDALQLIKSDSFLLQQDVAIRTNEWKLIYRKSRDFQEKFSWWRVLSNDDQQMKDYELYNLALDPQEKENVIDTYPVIAENLKEELEPFLKNIKERKINVPIRKTLQEYF